MAAPPAREAPSDVVRSGRRDPGERTNLAAAQPAVVAELSRLIAQRFAGLKRRGGHQELPEDVKKRLKALGYVAH